MCFLEHDEKIFFFFLEERSDGHIIGEAEEYLHPHLFRGVRGRSPCLSTILKKIVQIVQKDIYI